MSVIELAIHARKLAVSVGKIKEWGRLVMSAGKSLTKQRGRCNPAIGTAENHVSIESVAAAAHTRVPSGVAERLIEHAVAAADNGLRIQGQGESHAWSKCFVEDAFG